MDEQASSTDEQMWRKVCAVMSDRGYVMDNEADLVVAVASVVQEVCEDDERPVSELLLLARAWGEKHECIERQGDGSFIVHHPIRLTSATQISPLPAGLPQGDGPQLLEDVVHIWQAPTGQATYHRRAWRRSDGQALVIVGDLDDNEGMSLMNAIEHVIGHAIAAYGDEPIIIDYINGRGDGAQFSHLSWSLDERGKVSNAGWAFLDIEGLTDMLEGHVPRMWPEGEYTAQRAGAAAGPTLTPVPGWLSPHDRSPDAQLRAQAQLRGTTPAGLALDSMDL